MNKFLLISLCAIVSVLAYAQEDKKYLAGAVPEVDGRVVFSKSIAVKNPISDADLFDLMNNWATENYGKSDNKDLNNRVLLSNKDELDIACQGAEFLVFRKNAFVLDQAKFMYQLILNTENGSCLATIRSIKYEYSDSKSYLPAEEMITDKVAVNKKGDKLNRYYDKFRTQTIDNVEEIFASIDKYLNGTTTGGAVAAATLTPATPVTTSEPIQITVTNVPSQGSAMAAFKQVDAGKIPESLKGSNALMLSGSVNNPSVMPVQWGGVATLMGKSMALITVNSAQSAAIDNAETYTISFYTEIYADALKQFENTKGNINDKIKASGLTPVMSSDAPAFSEAWMIIECRKAGVMPSTDSNATSDKTYLGEIINVWIK
ncbi:DUF4468 domain-containing protein [Prevotella sp. 10(H)]|uniref:DUF4468 domain-containing protein n=1 Tax=Prevotella sp. 10(H) TaxID=1158294 RepID=UPI0004A6DCB5|nr:DUF4468 domain-containing protein [Prevotella sp. 10(H)]